MSEEFGTVGMVEGGCFVRGMSDRERWAWDKALETVAGQDADEATDSLCRWANRAEKYSHTDEHRGLHFDATDWQIVAELFDAAAESPRLFRIVVEPGITVQR